VSEVDENQLIKKTKQLRKLIEELQQQYGELQHFLNSYLERGQSFDTVLRTDTFSKLMEKLTLSGDCSDSSIFTLLAPCNNRRSFSLLLGSFSDGWYRKHEKMVSKIAESGTTLPAEKGMGWYAISLFQHRPYSYTSSGKLTVSDHPYREITAYEYLIKALAADLLDVFEEGTGGIAKAKKSIYERWISQIESHLDSFPIPDVLLNTKRDELRHFCTMDGESIELFLNSQSANRGSTTAVKKHSHDNISSAVNALFTFFPVIFAQVSGLRSEQLVKRKPAKEAIAYWKLLKKTVSTQIKDQQILDVIADCDCFTGIPATWFEWLISVTIGKLACILCDLSFSDRELLQGIIHKLDVRSGPLSWAMHLQHIRIMPVAFVAELMGVAISQFQYTELHMLEKFLADYFPDQESFFASIHEDILRNFYATCLHKLVNEQHNSQVTTTITQQKEIIMEDSIRLFCRVSSGVISGRDLFKEYPAILGRSLPMQEVYRRIRKVASTSEPVLILGETGTGKELVAKAINRMSRRSSDPFIVLNSAAIPEELVESELFGHEKGAFTGATSKKRGKFELADKGTLFLDEIGDMSLKTQARILRVIQEQTFERVGGDATYKVDVRLIAATHKNLSVLIGEGGFRDDLFYRLSVYPILLPSLRDRPEDIPLLAVHFILEKQGQIPDLSIKQISPAALQLLMKYPWPGNVRQLRNAIGAIMVDFVGEGKDIIEREDLEKALKPLEFKRPGMEVMPRQQFGMNHASQPIVSAVEKQADYLPVSVPTVQRFSEEPMTEIGGDITSEVNKWMSRFVNGEQLQDHKQIFRAYGEEKGMRIYLELFEAGKRRYGTYKNFIEHVGLKRQHSAIRNKLLMFRRKLDERGE